MERWLWTQKQNIGPMPRRGHSMVYDSARKGVLLFGGSIGGINSTPMVAVNDTWSWDSTSWTQVADTGPSPRSGHAIAYDSIRQKIVLFGGAPVAGGAERLGDTWEWDGIEWTQVADIGPSPRTGHAMAYDSQEKKTVLFGGLTSAYLNDTWEWNGTEWTQVADTGPSPRVLSAVTYDESSQSVVIFGGSNGEQQVPGDTWEWKGKKWKKVQDIGPGPLSSSDMVYTIHGVILFGGIKLGSGEKHADTWKWDGKFWTKNQDIGPPPRSSHAMAYDAQRDRVVLFSGAMTGNIESADTWELRIESGGE